MTTTRWYRNFGSGRGAPAWRRPALALAAIAALISGGCSSLGGNRCSTCGDGPLSRLRAGLGTIGSGSGCGSCGRRLFGGRAADPCEPGIGVGVPVEAAPGAVIPGPGPLPGPAVPATPATPAEDVPSVLEKAPGSSEGTPPEGKNGNGVKSAVYESNEPRVGGSPTRRESMRPAAPQSSPVDEVLSDLPPITASVGGGSPPSSALPEDAAPAAEGPVAAKSEAEDKPEESSPPSPPAAPLHVGAAPGIDHFKVVEPQLAGGSLPSASGWAWLAEKGYKTVLDLRERAEARPEDFAAIDRLGLIHVGLPVTPATLDEKNLERFDQLLAQAGSRPLFFFDNDGARAASLWYVHRVMAGKADSQEAAREAEEIGRRDPNYWAAATALLAKLKPAPAAANPEPAVASPPPPAVVKPEAPPAPPQPQASAESKVAESPAAPDPAASPTPPEPALPAEPAAWKPYAAVIVTGLTIPLAFVGRSALINLGSSVKASLPAPARRPRPLPDASGE